MSQSQPLLVTAALIRDEDRVLLAQRKPDSRFEPNKWEFPGGKVELYEHPENALKREIQEELGLEIEVERFFMPVSHVYGEGSGRLHVVLLCYLCRRTGGTLTHLQVQDSRWIKIQDLGSIDIAAADVPVVAELQQLTHPDAGARPAMPLLPDPKQMGQESK